MSYYVCKIGSQILGGLIFFCLGLVFFFCRCCCVWSCVPCLRLCEVDDNADGALDAADGADFDVADD